MVARGLLGNGTGLARCVVCADDKQWSGVGNGAVVTQASVNVNQLS